MALRNQPYIPLYVQDIMTDEKLNECCAATHGIYIKGIICLMHKSDTYGCLLLKQKYKQSTKQSYNFASQLVKHLPYTEAEIEAAIDELIEEKVCYYDGEMLCQKRMIDDNNLSVKRSKAGSKGGSKTGNKFAEAKVKANSESESAIIITEDNIKELTNNYSMQEEVGRMLRTSPQVVAFMLSDFITEQKAKGDLNRALGDVRRHFVSWCKVNKDNYNKVKHTPKKFKSVTDESVDFKEEHRKFLEKAAEQGVNLPFVKQ